MTKIAHVCADCGSDDVRTNQVDGYWNVDKQDFDYEHYDNRWYCSCCGDEGSTDQIEYVPARWQRNERDFDVGDVVKFESDMCAYSELHNSNKIPADTDHALAVVVEKPDEWNSKWNSERETIAIRLFTGELVEVWPRDVYVREETDEQK